MSYESFSHNGNNYFLYLANHVQSAYPSIRKSKALRNLDVLVFEGYCEHDKAYTGFSEWRCFKPYREIFDHIEKESPNVKVYFPDCDINWKGIGISAGIGALTIGLPAFYFFNNISRGLILNKKEMNRRQFLKKVSLTTGTGLISLSFLGQFFNGFSDGKDIEAISEVNNLRTSLMPTPLVGFRNASLSRVIEEYIVPKEKKQGLTIGIVYGAGHSGIERTIKHKWLRDTIISGFEDLGYPGINHRTLNQLVMGEHDSKCYGKNKNKCYYRVGNFWIVKRENTNLFR